jgi:maltooligosyltrehalose trehalohydrolase
MLFQGEEWASTSPFLYFVDFEDEPDLAPAVAEGRRREFESFGWEPDEIPNPNLETSFSKSKLCWDELAATTHAEMLTWYKSVIKLRRNLSALTNGRLNLTKSNFNEKENWLCVERGSVKILCNFSSQSVMIPCETGGLIILLDSCGDCRIHHSRAFVPREAIVFVGPKVLQTVALSHMESASASLV